MTLAVGVVTADGVVVAADSRTTYAPSNTNPRVVSDFAHKVFQVKDIAFATYGAAFLQNRNIAGHAGEFAGLSTATTFPAFVAELRQYFDQLVQSEIAAAGVTLPNGAVVMGFLIGGIDAGHGQLYEVQFPGAVVTQLHNAATNCGATWRGQTDVVRRIIKGVDIDLMDQESAAANLSPEFMRLQPAWQNLEYVIPFQAMNLQDAVDLAAFLIRTTIDVQRLTHGTLGQPGSWPGVGGPIEIAAISPVGGLEWVQRTKLIGDSPSGRAEVL